MNTKPQANDCKKIKIQSVKKGDFLKLAEKSNVVYVADGYNRSTKKYSLYKFDDINSFTEKRKDTIVFIDFTF